MGINVTNKTDEIVNKKFEQNKISFKNYTSVLYIHLNNSNNKINISIYVYNGRHFLIFCEDLEKIFSIDINKVYDFINDFIEYFNEYKNLTKNKNKGWFFVYFFYIIYLSIIKKVNFYNNLLDKKWNQSILIFSTLKNQLQKLVKNYYKPFDSEGTFL